MPDTGVVVGTSTGSVYLVKSSMTEPQFLSAMDSIPGQVNNSFHVSVALVIYRNDWILLLAFLNSHLVLNSSGMITFNVRTKLNRS